MEIDDDDWLMKTPPPLTSQTWRLRRDVNVSMEDGVSQLGTVYLLFIHPIILVSILTGSGFPVKCSHAFTTVLLSPSSFFYLAAETKFWFVSGTGGSTEVFLLLHVIVVYTFA